LDVDIEPFCREVAKALGYGVEKHLFADAHVWVHLHQCHLLERLRGDGSDQAARQAGGQRQRERGTTESIEHGMASAV